VTKVERRAVRPAVLFGSQLRRCRYRPWVGRPAHGPAFESAPDAQVEVVSQFEGLGGIRSPLDAVRAAIVAENKRRKR
jgi:hypothetical protein